MEKDCLKRLVGCSNAYAGCFELIPFDFLYQVSIGLVISIITTITMLCVVVVILYRTNLIITTTITILSPHCPPPH